MTSATALVLAACQLNATGSGTSADGTSTTPASDPSSEGTSAGGTATALPVDDTAAGSTTDAGHPSVTIAAGALVDFGPTDLADATEQVLLVTNDGDADATAVQVEELEAPFVVASHDCPSALAPGATCGVRVRFEPDRFGDAVGEARVAYEDRGEPSAAAGMVVGRGIGVTGNLLVNPGGELGEATAIPPMGWTLESGSNWSASWGLVAPLEGARTISAGYGPPDLTQFTLHQVVPVAALTTWGDAEGVRFYYRAHHGGEADGDDPTWVELRFRSSSEQLEAHPSEIYTGAAWHESAADFVAPAETRYVQLALQCTRVVDTWCSGFFDDLEVWAEWAG